jgi:hypothetical protein
LYPFTLKYFIILYTEILTEKSVTKLMMPKNRIINRLMLTSLNKNTDKKITPRPTTITRKYDARIMEYVFVRCISARFTDLISINQVGMIRSPIIRYSFLSVIGGSKK